MRLERMPVVAGLCVGMVVLAGPATAWDPFGLKGIQAQIDSARRQFETEMAETRSTVAHAVDIISKSIPGERYLRLIDDLNSSDHSKVRAAQSFLTNLANLDVTKKYSVVVAYDFDEPDSNWKPFKTDFQVFLAPDPLILKIFIDNHSINMRTPGRIHLIPISQPHIREIVANNILSSLEKIFGSPSISLELELSTPRPQALRYTRAYPNTIFKDFYIRRLVSSSTGESELAQMQADSDQWLHETRASIAASMTDAIMAAYQYRETRIEGSKERRPWNPLKEQNFVVVFVDDATFDSHDDWTVKIYLEEDEEKNSVVGGRSIFSLTKADFDPAVQKSNPMILAENGTRYYWAFCELTRDPSLSAGNLNEWQKLREQLRQWADTRSK